MNEFSPIEFNSPALTTLTLLPSPLVDESHDQEQESSLNSSIASFQELNDSLIASSESSNSDTYYSMINNLNHQSTQTDIIWVDKFNSTSTSLPTTYNAVDDGHRTTQFLKETKKTNEPEQKSSNLNPDTYENLTYLRMKARLNLLHPSTHNMHTNRDDDYHTTPRRYQSISPLIKNINNDYFYHALKQPIRPHLYAPFIYSKIYNPYSGQYKSSADYRQNYDSNRLQTTHFWSERLQRREIASKIILKML